MNTILQKLRQRSRWALMRGVFGLGLGAGWHRDRPGVRILLYHGVVPPPVRRINARFVSTTALDAQLGWLRRRFQMVSLDQVYAGDYDPKRMAVAVTFDDGYRNNLAHALPILHKHRVPATIFVTAPRAAGQDLLWADALDVSSALLQHPLHIGGTEFRKNRKGEYMDAAGVRLKSHCKAQGPAFHAAVMAELLERAEFRSDREWDDYWQLLDADGLQTLASAPGISIGGHGTLHLSLDRLPLEAALLEVETGRKWIESSIGKPIHSFAFPDGAYHPQLVDALAGQGWTQLLLSEYRFHDQADPRLRERFTVHPTLPTKVLMAEMLKGHYF